MSKRSKDLALDRLVDKLLQLVAANADSNRGDDGCLPSTRTEREEFKDALRDAVVELTAEEDY